jgi:protein-L-isoaspartate(D-aspartate) O-methyltransferase
MSSSSEANSRNHALIDALKSAGDIRTPEVEAAFRAVPRHLFLPGHSLDDVYRDHAIRIKYEEGVPVSSSSQPGMMAIMLELLELRHGQRVLEIGAGTGFNAALMSHIVGHAGSVTTVDVDLDLVLTARSNLENAGFGHVSVVHADGAFGHAPAAPYDRIILTVGAPRVAPAWYEQLSTDARLLVALSIRGPQALVAFARTPTSLRSARVMSGGFVRLRGAFAGSDGRVPLGSETGLFLEVDDKQAVNPSAVFELVTGGHCDIETQLEATVVSLAGFEYWLALRESANCRLGAHTGTPHAPVVPALFREPNVYATTIGLRDADGLCVLRAASRTSVSEESAPVELGLRCYGHASGLAARLRDHLLSWSAAGRPTANDLVVNVLPDAPHGPLGENETAVVKDGYWTVFGWNLHAA